MLRRPVLNWLRRLSGLAEVPDTPHLDSLLRELDRESAGYEEYVPTLVAVSFWVVGFYYGTDLLRGVTEEPLVYLFAWLGVLFAGLGLRALCRHWLGIDRKPRSALRGVGRRLAGLLVNWRLLWYEPVSPFVLADLETASAMYLRARSPFSALIKRRMLGKLDPVAASALEAMEWALVDLFEMAIRHRGAQLEMIFRQPWVEGLLSEMRAMAEELEARARSLSPELPGDFLPALYRLRTLRKELQQSREAKEELEQR